MRGTINGDKTIAGGGEALDERQAKSLAKDLSGERKGGIEELRTIPGFVESEPSIRKENALHLAMMEAKKRSGLTQTEIAIRLGMPQPNVSRIEHSEVVTFNTFAEYLFACGFDFTINLRVARDNNSTRVHSV